MAAVLDLYSRAIVGWSMSDAMTTQFVSDALTMAIWRRGCPHENYEVYRNSSPITFIRNVVKYGRTPTLILQGEVDDIDPISQSQIWYRGLRRYGVETEMVIYPREGDGLEEAPHLRDRLTRTVAWFDKYLKQ